MSGMVFEEVQMPAAIRFDEVRLLRSCYICYIRELLSSAGLMVTEKRGRTRLAADKVSDLVFLRNVWEYCRVF